MSSARPALWKRSPCARSVCARSDLNLFYHVSRLGAMLLAPLALADAYSNWPQLVSQLRLIPERAGKHEKSSEVRLRYTRETQMAF